MEIKNKILELEALKLPCPSMSFVNIPLAENAPADLCVAMGKNGQFIDVVPGKSLVVFRMGEAPENTLVPAAFHNQMREKISVRIGN